MSSEGLDIPSLDTLVFATPRTDIVQSVGRIVRQHDDKCDPLIIDIDDQHATFRAGWKKRLVFYRKHSYAIQEESYQTHRNSKDSNCSSSESSGASESLDDEDESSDSDELTGAHHRTHTHTRRNRVSVKDTLRSTPAQGGDEPCAAQQRASTREKRGRAVVSEHKRGGCNEGGYSRAGNGSGGVDNDDESMDDGDESAFINDDNDDLDQNSDGSYHIGDDAASDSISGPVGESGVGSVAIGGERLEGGADAMCRDEPDQLREGDLREGIHSDAQQQIGVRVRRRGERHRVVGGSPWGNSGPERRDIGADQLGTPRSRTPKGSENHNEYSGANRSVDAGGTLEEPKRQRKCRRRPRQKVTGPDSELPEDGAADENILDSDEESAVPFGDQWKAAESSDDQWNGSDSRECDDVEDDKKIQQSDSDAKSTDKEGDDGGCSDSDSAEEKHVTT
ncbi:hypothetical protein, variant [Sphaeroforma arctica JP610]|uniref:Uncharacterized protein n=1 Tax=Sphaeroforma arctica JP610 TaxID=667725 RepID=A0A0L0FJN7_9EUKA|nr:hypothetical protein, variant [Sphaeroforma arctica JP610]KNC76676.1 hypothetical protein, variant [Sphaeroforma arctica JP610]|eukprot:XP_014150578.1 hypothetical protein, variant [Sphaeroforma arctica JP610]